VARRDIGEREGLAGGRPRGEQQAAQRPLVYCHISAFGRVRVWNAQQAPTGGPPWQIAFDCRDRPVGVIRTRGKAQSRR
jgi:hypothetical protein